MTECCVDRRPSLLPYLDLRKPGLRLWSRALTASEDAEPLSGVFDSFGPYACIGQTVIGAVGEHSMFEVFLVIQPDRYPYCCGELQPITNHQVDVLWQAAFCRLREQDKNFFPALPEQVGGDGRLIPLRPLFFCRHKNRFAHALCPRCGAGLDVCRDDGLLETSGLPGYAESLERFLFCPACRQEGVENRFYALAAPSGSPACLHDCDHLIASFINLLDRQDLAEDLPCVGCEAAMECYNPGQRVRERLRPLFFFPFYMLMQPAPSIHLLDFLEIVSGAAFDAVVRQAARQRQEGRVRRLKRHREALSSPNRFLFSDDARLFGEVLYLKLTVLEEIVDLSIRMPDILHEPARRMSLDSFWVHLPVQNVRLPLFWNFSLRLINAVGGMQNVAESNCPPAPTRSFLSRAWWYVLLVNEHQGMAAVLTAISNAEDSERKHGETEWLAGDKGLDPVFNPANLLRKPLSLPLDPEWECLWRRALALGSRLQQPVREDDANGSITDFRRRLEALRKDIHGHLFMPPTAGGKQPRVEAPASVADISRAAADRQIAAILRKFMAQWPPGNVESRPPISENQEEVANPSQAAPNEDGDFEETVVLDMRGVQTRQAAVPPAEASQEDPDGAVRPEPWEAAIALSSRESTPETAAPYDHLEKTVVMRRPVDPAQSTDRASGDILEKTVVISPRGGAHETARCAPGSVPGGSSGGTERTAEPAELEKTVVLRSDPIKNRKSKP